VRVASFTIAVLSLVASATGCATSRPRVADTTSAFGAAHTDRRALQSANTRVLSASRSSDSDVAAPSSVAQRVTSDRAPTVATQSAAAPSASDIEERTTPVAGTDVQAGLVVAEIDAPFSIVSATLLDFASYRQFLPRITESRVVRRRRGETDVYLRAELLDGLGVVWALERFRVTRATDSLLIEGVRLDGTMQRFDVRIEAAAIAGTERTRMAVQLLGIPPFPLPSSFLTRMHGRWTARSFRALRDWVQVQRSRTSAAPDRAR
jgi:hypothetical protein